MVIQEEFKCSICGETHSIIYNRMLLGPPPEISQKDAIKLKDDIYEYGNSVFIKGLVLVPLMEQKKHLEWVNWVQIEKDNWNEFIGNISKGKDEVELEGELMFGIPQYEGSENLNVVIGFADTYEGFIFFDSHKNNQLGLDQYDGLNNSQLENLFERFYHSRFVEEARDKENKDFSTNDIDLAIWKMNNIEGIGAMHVTNGKEVLFQITTSGNLELFQDESDMKILGIDIPVDNSFDEEREKQLDEYKFISSYKKGEVDGIILYQRLFKDDLENMKIEIYEIAKDIFGTSAENIEFEVFKAQELKNGLD